MPTHQHKRSLVLGLVAAAIAPATLVSSYILLSGFLHPPSVFNIIIPVVTLFVGLMISVPTCMALGAPAVLLLRHFGWLTVYSVCLAAAVCGALGLAIANYHLNYFPAAGARAHEMAMNSAMGSLAGGTVLGLIAGSALCLASGIQWRRARQI